MAHKKAQLETKTCPVCQRPFANRKKWSARGVWYQVVYCSDACRAKGRP
jgi:hypothetical protein